MFHDTDFQPDDTVNKAEGTRIAEGLEPYRAPSGRSQLVSALILIAIVTVLLFIVS